nr:hypothetical protein [uncultured Albidiferax sp.]
MLAAAVGLGLSWFSDLGYLFSAYAWVGGTRHPSDMAVIAEALWLPYWFWDGVVALLTCTVALLGAAYASRGQKRKQSDRAVHKGIENPAALHHLQRQKAPTIGIKLVRAHRSGTAVEWLSQAGMACNTGWRTR